MGRSTYSSDGLRAAPLFKAGSYHRVAAQLEPAPPKFCQEIMSNVVIHTMPVPIESGSEVPQVLRDRGVTDEVFAGYLSDVRTAYDDVHGSEGKVVMISMLVVLVITIPFVLRYFSKNAKEMNRPMAEINRGLEPYGVCGPYPSGSKLGPGHFEFRTI